MVSPSPSSASPPHHHHPRFSLSQNPSHRQQRKRFCTTVAREMAVATGLHLGRQRTEGARRQVVMVSDLEKGFKLGRVELKKKGLCTLLFADLHNRAGASQ